MDTLDFDRAASFLVPRGWQESDRALTSPSGGFTIDLWALERPTWLLGGVARRAEEGRLQGHPHVHEYEDLLAFLRTDPELQRVILAVDHLRDVLDAWAPKHAGTISCWDHSSPAARALGRHPAGGGRVDRVLRRRERHRRVGMSLGR